MCIRGVLYGAKYTGGCALRCDISGARWEGKNVVLFVCSLSEREREGGESVVKQCTVPQPVCVCVFHSE